MSKFYNTFVSKLKKNKETGSGTRESPADEQDDSLLAKDSSRSCFFPEYLISTENGILILCTSGLHAFLVVEYLVMNEAPENGYSRAFQRMDFGPANLAHVLIGRGNLRVGTKIATTNSDVEEITTKLKTGPHWKVKVTKVVNLFNSVYDGHRNGQLSLLYSLPGDSSQSSLPKNSAKQVNNCLTFSRNFLIKYGEEIGLEKKELECINGCIKWIPAQSPIPIVLHYKNKQKHTIEN